MPRSSAPSAAPKNVEKNVKNNDIVIPVEIDDDHDNNDDDDDGGVDSNNNNTKASSSSSSSSSFFTTPMFNLLKQAPSPQPVFRKFKGSIRSFRRCEYDLDYFLIIWRYFKSLLCVLTHEDESHAYVFQPDAFDICDTHFIICPDPQLVSHLNEDKFFMKQSVLLKSCALPIPADSSGLLVVPQNAVKITFLLSKPPLTAKTTLSNPTLRKVHQSSILRDNSLFAKIIVVPKNTRAPTTTSAPKTTAAAAKTTTTKDSGAALNDFVFTLPASKEAHFSGLDSHQQASSAALFSPELKALFAFTALLEMRDAAIAALRSLGCPITEQDSRHGRYAVENFATLFFPAALSLCLAYDACLEHRTKTPMRTLIAQALLSTHNNPKNNNPTKKRKHADDDDDDANDNDDEDDDGDDAAGEDSIFDHSRKYVEPDLKAARAAVDAQMREKEEKGELFYSDDDLQPPPPDQHPK